MARIQFKGLEEYLRNLQKAERNTPEILGKIVYNMADIVADAVRANIDALPARPDTEALRAYKKKEKTSLTVSEKRGLQEGFGISPLQSENGYWHVKLGFDGYNGVKTKKYPNGQPNTMIARAVESGSSIRDKHPFARPAVNRTKKEAEKKAQLIIDEELKNLN